MRVTTLFKRLLRLDGVRVVAAELEGEPGRERVVVDLERPARRRLRCPRCGFRTRASYDRSLRTLRHLDVLSDSLLPAPRGAPPRLAQLWCRRRGAAVRQGREPLHARVRGHLRLAGQGCAQDRGLPAHAGRLRDGGAHGRAGRRRGVGGRRGLAPGAAADRDRRGLLPQRPPLPPLRRLPRHGPDRLGRSGEEPGRPQRLLRRARRGGVRPSRGRLGRHARRLGRGDPQPSAQRAPLHRSLPRRPGGRRGTRDAPPPGTGKGCARRTPSGPSGSRAPASSCAAAPPPSARENGRSSTSSPRRTSASTAAGSSSTSCAPSTRPKASSRRRFCSTSGSRRPSRASSSPSSGSPRRSPSTATGLSTRSPSASPTLEAMNSTIRLISHRSRGFRRLDPRSP
jgi:hypothetical protein